MLTVSRHIHATGTTFLLIVPTLLPFQYDDEDYRQHSGNIWLKIEIQKKKVDMRRNTRSR